MAKSKRPDRLAKQFLADALEYHRRALWTCGESQSLILLHLPGEDDFFVATLFGHSGQERGVLLQRGEQGFIDSVQGQYASDEPHQLAGDELHLAIDSLGSIPQPLRGPLEAAGFQGRRELMAPWLALQSSHEEPRPARRAELRQMTWALRGLLLAHDQGLLAPPDLGLLPPQLLEIEVLGESMKAARVKVALAPWPVEVPGFGEDLEPLPEPVAEPSTVEEWQVADDYYFQKNAELTQDQGLWTEETELEYYGSGEVLDGVFSRADALPHEGSYLEWLLADFRATKRSKTWLEKLLRAKDLKPAERVLAQARVDADLILARTLASGPGQYMDVENIVTGARERLWDGKFAAGIPVGTCLPLRLLRVADWVLPSVAGPPLAGSQVDQVLVELAAHGADLENLRATPNLLGLFWRVYLEAPDTPVLTNTDGDDLAPQSASFLLEDPSAFVPALEAREDIREEDGSWVWTRADEVGGQQGRTVLGRLELMDVHLVLDVNSRERLSTARAWIEDLPGGACFEHATEKEFTGGPGIQGSRPLDDQLPGPPPEPMPPEVLKQVADMLLARQKAWIDESIPMLDGLTPREACKTKQGRQRVAAMVRSMPPVGTPDGPIEPPREWLLAELGLGDPD